jgi:hypothetical protein
MCTVTLIAGRSGYALGMNRDEKLTRLSALPPQRLRLGKGEALFPSEPSGGAWVGVNDCGITLALINWYSVRERACGRVISRGDIVRSLLGEDSFSAIAESIAVQPLHSVNPFRLIGIFPERRVVEWRWDIQQLHSFDHPWRTRAWISSGFDEPGAQRVRGNFFAEALSDAEAETLPWLRRLHASHAPRVGPYSMCMHRDDAATVSYTEIEVAGGSATLRYTACAPCHESAIHSKTLPVLSQPRIHDQLYAKNDSKIIIDAQSETSILRTCRSHNPGKIGNEPRARS